MIAVQNTVKVYEIDEADLRSVADAQPILVRSHWNNNNIVILEIGDRKYTVVAKDLKTAIDNATNTARF